MRLALLLAVESPVGVQRTTISKSDGPDANLAMNANINKRGRQTKSASTYEAIPKTMPEIEEHVKK